MKSYVKIGLFLLAALVCGPHSKACICSETLTVDSLQQLKDYAFIAYVKIVGDRDLPKQPAGAFGTVGELTIEIVELFKGSATDKIIEYYKKSSCDMGFAEGQEWIIFAQKTAEGYLAVFPCDRNVVYRNKDETRDWKYGRGITRLLKLRKLYDHPVPVWPDGIRQEYYTSGLPEIEEHYKAGKLEGERKVWHPNGQLQGKEFYLNDSLDGRSQWFYPSGQISHDGYYVKGKPYNVSRYYYDSSIDKGWEAMLVRLHYKTVDSMRYVYNRVQVMYETVYDSQGREIVFRQYTRLGIIRRETFYNPDKKLETSIYYHDNGLVSSIENRVHGKGYGRYQTYDENGVPMPKRSWDYDENGKQVWNK